MKFGDIPVGDILREEYPFLDYDSFIGCGHLVEYGVEDDVQGYWSKSTLSGSMVDRLLVHLNREVKTLTRAQYRKVARHLKILARKPPA
ncbi:MAG: hypothetical protein AAB152_08995 [Candidatus Coatesbacteria bacterium]